jgi:phage shock protein C
MGTGEGTQAKGPEMARSLSRPPRGEGRLIAGVCRGIAERFGVSTFLVRLGFVIFGFVGAGEIAYIVLWILMPTRSRSPLRRPR